MILYSGDGNLMSMIRQLIQQASTKYRAMFAQRKAKLNLRKAEQKYQNSFVAERFPALERDSIDEAPWRHPYLSERNIRRFREYSETVWQIALDHSSAHPSPMKIAFMVNMAQNMHKWARIAQGQGADVTLFLHPLDNGALSCPEWEEFDGESLYLQDRNSIITANPGIHVDVPYKRIGLEGSALLSSYYEFQLGNRKPLMVLLSRTPGIRHEVFFKYEGFYPYYSWAKELTEFDVLYAASSPLAAYASGRPYCLFSVGGDLMFDCGRGDDYGRLMSLSFNAARFILASNPHTLGHSRRLGFSNAVYLPYPMDDGRYCPGEGQARKRWEEMYGTGIYVLMTSRLDAKYKGQDNAFFAALVNAVRQRPQLRLVFLAWGENANAFRKQVEAAGLSDHFIILNPVGKKRLIDYYRSCDIVLDSFVYGYYGATALEAAAVGKPVIMKLRKEHYAPLYNGDVMPVFHADTSGEMGNALITLCDRPALRLQSGEAMRSWLVRNHGEQKTAPLMLALLRLTANCVALPEDLCNPLLDEETEEERIYHEACLRKRK